MMTPLLKQFISESREQLQSISEALLGLEKGQDPTESLNELFGMVHTLKGSSGLFDFPEMTHVLHAGEDVLTEIREKPDLFTQELGDLLFEVLDFVSQQMDELEENDGQLSSRKELANDLESRLRACHPDNQAADNQTVSAESNEVESAATAAPRNESDNEPETDLGSEANDDAKQPDDTTSVPACSDLDSVSDPETVPFPLSKIPEDVRQQAVDELLSGNSITLLCYTPDEQCFFAGEDPFLQIRHTPGLLWGQINTRDELAGIDTLDPFQCLLEFWCVSQAETSDLEDYFRVQPEAVQFYTLLAQDLILPASSHEAIHYSHETLREFYRHYASRDVGSLISDLQSELEHQEEQGLRITDNDLSWLLRIANRQPDHPLMEFLWKRLCESARFDPMEEAELTDRADSAITNLKPSQPVCREQMTTLLETQRHILSLPNEEAWSGGRIQAAGNALSNMMESTGQTELQQQARSHITETLNNGDNQAITDWLDGLISGELWPDHASQEESVAPAQAQSPDVLNSASGSDEPAAKPTTTQTPGTQTPGTQTTVTQPTPQASKQAINETEPVESLPGKAESPSDTQQTSPEITTDPLPIEAEPIPESSPKQPASNSRQESQPVNRSVKVDQEKIDRLMSLIGEMAVAKNSLPFLAQKAERAEREPEQYSARDLSRDIKEQYSVINRIAEEMQDAIMQIRMMPFSFISMRFPRLVRDISRRLGKDIQLSIEGEDTEADKNIIESLSDPLIHIVRNSLDHGIEMPEERVKAGKPASGRLSIRASQEADRVLIEITDDGKGIDPEKVKQKAIAKGLMDEAAAERLSPREALNLVLLPGFSTADSISDLSGRGVGMDAVRRAVDKVNGALALDSEPGKGTRVRIQLPMSIAVTRVMMIETDGQLMGIPMDQVLETVRVHQDNIHQLKQVKTTVLRDRIIPLKCLNTLLNLNSAPMLNEDQEYAVLVIRVGNETVGLMVDNFRGSADIIQKPLNGVLGGVNAYSGAALVGDGSVLMVLNPRELI